MTYAIQEIKEKLNSIEARHQQNGDRLTRIEENSNYMRKVIEGNGKPGLLGDVEALKKWMYEEQGVSHFRRWLTPVVLSLVFGCISALGTVWAGAALAPRPVAVQPPAPAHSARIHHPRK